MEADDDMSTKFRFEAAIIHWRGPSPFFFAPVPPEHSARIGRLARFVTYGWGMIPVKARIGEVVFSTSLYPKGDRYYLPLKTAVRLRAGITADDVIVVEMTIQPTKA